MFSIKMTVFCLATLVFVFPSFFATCLGDEKADLRPFDGFYTFGWIAGADQKELNLGEADFIIEFKVNPDKITRLNLPDCGIVAKKPFGNRAGYCAGITMKQDLSIYLNDVDGNMVGTEELPLTIPGYFKEGVWVHTAIVFERAKNRLSVYSDGKLVKEIPDVRLSSLDNWADFTIGTAEIGTHPRFKGAIEYVGVWKFPRGLPGNYAELAAKMAASDSRVEPASIEGVRYSFWKLAKSDKGVQDLGICGNFLYYMPENEKLRFEAMEKPFKPEAPKTIYVDINNPSAGDEGEGKEDRPFKSIQRAALFAQAGDTVQVKKGLYREALSISGGRPGAPIRIVGEEGTVVTGAELLSGWKKSETDGVYVFRGWTGKFTPGDPKQFDSRKNPDNIVYFNDAPLTWAEHVEDMIPGTYSIWPREVGKPMDIYVFPRPGEAIESALIEINVGKGVVLADFIDFEGFKVTKSDIVLNGQGCVLRNNTDEWGKGGVAVYGANHKVIGNKIMWGAITGMTGGGASGCLIENNLITCSNWGCYDPGWHGGGAKMIPSNIDNIIRGNTFTYNWGSGFWYDSFDAYNVIERNIIHDNSGNGGIFDECGWANKVQYNVVFNTWSIRQNTICGAGINIGETPDDYVWRNVVFNNERDCGLLIRSYANRETGSKGAEDVIADSVKYPHHYVRSELQKKWLGDSVKYYSGKYIPQTDMKFLENISFNNNPAQLWTMRDYRVKDDPRAQFYEFESDNNIYFNANDPDKIVITGMKDAFSLDKWREISGKDKNSRILDPFKDTDKLPQWARELVDFSKYSKMRSSLEIVKLNPEIRDCIGSLVFKSRIVRSTGYRKLSVQDPNLRAFLIDCEGEKMLALWRTFGAGQARIKTGASSVAFEDQWLRRKPMTAEDGAVVLYIGSDPVYLVGVTDDAGIDAGFKGKVYGTEKEVVVGRAPAKFKIDGNLEDWQAVRAAGPLAEINSERNVMPDGARKWEGPKDLSAKVYAAWDEGGLYCAFDVTDDSVMAGDSVELFIDGREAWRHFITEYQRGVCHLKLEPSAGALKISTPPLKGTYYTRKKYKPEGIEGVCAVSANGYTIEVFIPWTKENFPAGGLVKDTIIRLGLLLNDFDQGKTGAVTMKWYANRSNDDETSGWLPVALK